MSFLLASTWLALHVWVTEHAALLATVLVAGVTFRPRVRQLQ
ncbi:hypothetical protein [Blastococcus sp. TBT05-19]|nr:hypothetical protein [Blastococcus sp. TBT05-19]